MNEMIFLIFVTAILASWAVFAMVAITLADLRAISLEKALQRHPHARKWRGVTRLRKSLSLHGDKNLLPHKTVRLALAQFQANPATRFVEMIPRLMFPQTTQQFFAAYRMIASAPFVRLRAVLNVRSSQQQWPMFLQTDITKTHLEWCYSFAVWILAVSNISLITYIGSIAILGEPHYLLGYIAIFSLWLMWSIWSYPTITIRQKIFYLLFAPASLSYFLWRTIIAPFIPLRLLRLIAVRHRPVLS